MEKGVEFGCRFCLWAGMEELLCPSLFPFKVTS